MKTDMEEIVRLMVSEAMQLRALARQAEQATFINATGARKSFFNSPPTSINHVDKGYPGV